MPQGEKYNEEILKMVAGRNRVAQLDCDFPQKIAMFNGEPIAEWNERGWLADMYHEPSKLACMKLNLAAINSFAKRK